MPAEKVTANQALFNATVRHQVHVLRFSEQQAKDALKALRGAEGELLEQITGAMAKGLDPARLESLLASVKERRAQVYAQLGEDMEAQLKGLAEAEAEWEVGALDGASPIDLKLASVPIESLHAAVAAPIAGIPLKGWLDSVSATEASALQAAVTQSVLQGGTIDDLVRRIRGTKAKGFADGIMATSTRNAQALARTAVNHVSNQARELVWEANSDIVRCLRWTATLDGRTSPVCRARDGHMAPIGDSALLPSDQPLVPPGARPPAHFNCRSVLVAVLDGVELAGDRPFIKDARVRKDREAAFRKEAKDRGVPIQQVRQEWAANNVGQVPAATTYGEWLKTQPKSFQDELLGPERGAMFRQGVPLERFVDKSGRTLNLAELKAELAGDSLNVLQPAIGVKAKGLLMQGLEPDEVLSAIKSEFPEASTTAASIASYKSELKKAGLLGIQGTPAYAQKVLNLNTAGQLNILEQQLPVGVKNALQGQWATVVDNLTGHPGAYAHYKPGVGVELSDKKMTGLSKAQAQQVMAHELGHLLHKVHDVEVGSIMKQSLMTTFQELPADVKKLYSYYGVSHDELWAEVLGQALHDSPVTSQGVAAGPFKAAFEDYIDLAKKKLAKFDEIPAAVETGPVMKGIGEVAGKPTSIGGFAKALLQQGMPDEHVLSAVLAEFPSAKTTMNSIKSYKSELKKVEAGAIGKSGPTIGSQGSASIPTPVPAAPVPAKVAGFADPALELPKPTYEVVSLSGLTKVGSKPGGTNPGAVYVDAKGDKWLVKGNLQKVNGSVSAEVSDARARNEVLSARLIRYADKGLAPEMRLIDLEGQFGGGLGVMSRMLDEPIIKLKPDNINQVKLAQRDFALHAWLGNYDVVGATFDNLVFKAGKAVNIDPGGALLFRAQGLLKSDFGAKADTWDTMRSASKNAQAAKVYGGMTEDQLGFSAQALFAFTDEVIDEMVGAMDPGLGVDLRTVLKARRDDILKRAGLKMPSKADLPKPFATEVPTAVLGDPLSFLSAPIKKELDELIDKGYSPEAVAKIIYGNWQASLSADEVEDYLNWKLAKPEFEKLLDTPATIMVGDLDYDVFAKIDAAGPSDKAFMVGYLPPGPTNQLKSLFEGFNQKVKAATPKGLDKLIQDIEALASKPIGSGPLEISEDVKKSYLTAAAYVKAKKAMVFEGKAAPTPAPVLAPVYVAPVNYKAMTVAELVDAVVPPNLEIKSWYGKTKASWTIQQAAVPLFKSGVATDKVYEALVHKFGPTFVPKVPSLASMKSKLKKQGFLDGPVGAGVKGTASDGLPQPKLWGTQLGSKSMQVKLDAKALIAQGQDANQVTSWIATQFSSPNPVGAANLYELAHYEVKTGKVNAKAGASAVSQSHYTPTPSLPAPVPLRPATDIGEAGPPPPRFTKEGWQAGLQKYGGTNHMTDAKLATLNKRQKAAGLDQLEPEEYAAIKAYTNSAYGAVNSKLRDGQFAGDVYLQAWSDAAMHGLYKLPPWKGEVTRGMSVDSSTVTLLKQFYAVGAEVTEKQFTSTSDVARGGKGFGGNVRYHIQAKTGRDVRPISSHNGEQEILLVPGTRYRVQRVEPYSGGYGDGGIEVWMEEV